MLKHAVDFCAAYGYKDTVLVEKERVFLERYEIKYSSIDVSGKLKGIYMEIRRLDYDKYVGVTYEAEINSDQVLKIEMNKNRATMKVADIPKEIVEQIKDCDFKKNNIGKSASEVYIFSDKVLKIQEISGETRNERDICRWVAQQSEIQGVKVPVPRILVYCEDNNRAYTLESRVEGKMGPADRYTDIAICYRSIKHNFEGVYGGAIVCTDFTVEDLLKELIIELDEYKLRFYYLLDELF